MCHVMNLYHTSVTATVCYGNPTSFYYVFVELRVMQ